MQIDFSISTTEHETEEWKEVFNDDLLEQGMQTLCAFLNSHGGKIIFGVNKNGVGAPISSNLDETQTRIFDKARAHLKPNAHHNFAVKIHEGKIYIFVEADKTNIYQYKNVIYKRTGSVTHALTYAEAKTLEDQRKDHVVEVAPNFYRRIGQGEMLKCNNCGYTEVSGMSISASFGGPPPESKCPQCGTPLIKIYG